MSERKIYGPVKEGECGRIRNNYEINTILEGGFRVQFIKSRRIGWLEHVEKMSVERKPKGTLYGEVGGVKQLGRTTK